MSTTPKKLHNKSRSTYMKGTPEKTPPPTSPIILRNISEDSPTPDSRFTVLLPNEKKTVVVFLANKTLESVLSRICNARNLVLEDFSIYDLNGKTIELTHELTLGQLGVNEVVLKERNKSKSSKKVISSDKKHKDSETTKDGKKPKRSSSFKDTRVNRFELSSNDFDKSEPETNKDKHKTSSIKPPPTKYASSNAVLLACAFEYTLQGMHSKAISFYRSILDIQANDYAALSGLGTSLALSGDYNLALDCFKSCLLIRPDDPCVLNNYGLSLAFMGEINLSREVFKKITSIDNNNLHALNNEGVTSHFIGEDALPYFDRLLEKDPTHSVGLNNKGVILGTSGQFSEAAKYFQLAIEQDKYFLKAHMNNRTAQSLVNTIPAPKIDSILQDALADIGKDLDMLQNSSKNKLLLPLDDLMNNSFLDSSVSPFTARNTN